MTLDEIREVYEEETANKRGIDPSASSSGGAAWKDVENARRERERG